MESEKLTGKTFNMAQGQETKLDLICFKGQENQKGRILFDVRVLNPIATRVT